MSLEWSTGSVNKTLGRKQNKKNELSNHSDNEALEYITLESKDLQ